MDQREESDELSFVHVVRFMKAVVKKYRKMLTHYELGVLDGKAAKQAEAEALVESDAEIVLGHRVIRVCKLGSGG